MEIEVSVVLQRESFSVSKDFFPHGEASRAELLEALEKCYLAAKRFVEEFSPE